MVRWGWVLVAAVVGMGCRPRFTPVGGGGLGQAGRGQLQGEAPSVSAAALLRSFERNESAADRQYNDRTWILVDVQVDEIHGDAAWMKGESYNLRLTFADERDVVRLRIGGLAKARCEGDGVRDQDVKFDDCELLHIQEGIVGDEPEEPEDEEPKPRRRKPRPEPEEEPAEEEEPTPEEPEPLAPAAESEAPG